MPYVQYNIDLPRLEPYEEAEMEFEFQDETLGDISIQLKDMKVEGLSTFHVADLLFETLTFNFNMTIEVPKLSVSGWYKLSGEIPDLIELRGSGDMALDIEGIRIFMDGQMGHRGSDEHIWWMNRLRLEFSLENISGHMHGLMDDELLEDFFNFVMTTRAAAVIDEVFPDIEPEMVKVAMEMVPELLNGTPFLDVLNIIFLEKEFLMDLPEGVECPLDW